MQTGVGAVLNTAKVPAGSSVVVSGLGAVGLSIVQGARIAGATTIVAVDPNADRRAEAVRLGATHGVDPATERVDHVARDLTEGRGADFAFDAVGRGDVVETLMKATRNGGTTVMVGMPSTDDVVTVRALRARLLREEAGRLLPRLLATPPATSRGSSTCGEPAGSTSSRWSPRGVRSPRSTQAVADLRARRRRAHGRWRWTLS